MSQENVFNQEDMAILSDNGKGEDFADIMQRRLSRRGFLRAAAVASAAVAVAGTVGTTAAAAPAKAFDPITLRPNTEDDTVVPADHTVDILLRWGDPIVAGAPEWEVNSQTPAAQAQQFGFNCDFVGFMPYELGSANSERGLIVVNHEYTDPTLMFPGYVPGEPTQDQVDIELAAHGVSVVEIQRNADGSWSPNLNSSLNRRYMGDISEFILTGPVAGSDWVKTSADPDGVTVLGTLNNCAGGKTPWGTVLTAEENFHQYFANNDALGDDDPRKADHSRYGFPGGASARAWENYHSRFDIGQEPNEPYRFGYMVEIDPYNPDWTPRKRTALGRFRHEAATFASGANGEAVFYSGDDARFEYMYKFVSNGVYNPADRAANLELLDDGILYVAKLNDDGSGEWLPLVYGEGPLTEENGFTSQADVIVKTRQAGDLLGATRMDRPEDIETNPITNVTYVALTNNTRREADDTDPANPRAENAYGHILEIVPGNNDHASTSFSWGIFMLCGDPEDASTYFAGFPKDQVSAIANPDNVAFDVDGNLWITTDGQPRTLEANDAAFVVPVRGPERGKLVPFFSSVAGSEVCGPEFTPDNSTLFLAIQHPGEGGTFEAPISLWPDYAVVARPSLISIRQNDGGRVGVLATPSGDAAEQPGTLPQTGADNGGLAGPIVATLGAAAAAAGAMVALRNRQKPEAETE